jgi:hypothetical protein
VGVDALVFVQVFAMAVRARDLFGRIDRVIIGNDAPLDGVILSLMAGGALKVHAPM